MASTKTRIPIWSAEILAAGAGELVCGAIDLTDGYGAQLNLKLVNGATGPTASAQVQIEVSGDGVNWFKFGGPLSGGTSGNGVYSWSLDLPIGVRFLRLSAGGNSGQDVTAHAEVTEVSSLG